MGLKASDFPFQLGAYDPDAYYVHSTDRKGHHLEVRVALPPEIVRCLEVMVESKLWAAYRTKGDVVRDAIYHLIARRLKEVENPPKGSDVFWYALEGEQMREQERLREVIQRLVDGLDQQVRRLLADGLVEEAREQVERVLYRASKATDRKEAAWLTKAVRVKLADVWQRLGLPEEMTSSGGVLA